MSEKVLMNSERKPMISKETTRAAERTISPAVDIYETDEGLTLVADVPGLDEKALNMTIEGEASAGSGEFLQREFAMAGYWRQFHLPDTFDADKASAEIRHGVLTLHLPKAEKARPKQIKVTVH